MTPELKLSPDAMMSLPADPGLGIEIREDKPEDYTQTKKRFTK